MVEQTELSKLSHPELKAMAYDALIRIEQDQKLVQYVHQVVNVKGKQDAKEKR
jgi:hypothetical protein